MTPSLSHPFARLAMVALALVALLGARTATASAADWPDDAHMKVTAAAGSSMKIVDDESWPSSDEVATFSLGGTPFAKLNGFDTSSKTVVARCAGGEVRAELVTEVSTWSDTAGTAWVRARLDLYEGSSCQTGDLDGASATQFFVIKAGETLTKTFTAANVAEGGDSASATVKFSAAMGSGW